MKAELWLINVFVGFAKFSTKICATLGLTQSMTCFGAQQ
jgi:hypothetical protein